MTTSRPRGPIRSRVRALRSLRYRTLMVVVAVVVLPLVWVWIAGTFESSGASQRRALLAAATEAVTTPASELEDVARRHGVWLRILAPDGTITAHDHAPRGSVLEPVADPFYGPGGQPSLHDVDASLLPLGERTEVTSATTVPQARCTVVHRSLLLLCTASVALPDGRILHVTRGSPRLVRSLYEERFQLTALTLWVLVIGGLLALWLGWRMVGPIESLRDQVMARTEGGVSTEPVRLDRLDELGDLATAFNELLRALERRNRSNAAFVADLAHELKNPVAAVRAAAEVMASDHPMAGDRRDRLQRVLADASARMEVVVDRFLDLARAEAGLPDAPREDVDLHQLLHALVVPLAGDARFVAVVFEVDGHEAVVQAVPERLETALRNLLVNAAHFAAPTGRVTVGIRRRGDRIEVRVADTGPGIPPTDLPRIFDRYYTTRQGGTGLGLPLTKAIVEAHGGSLKVASTLGQGATFVAELPWG